MMRYPLKSSFAEQIRSFVDYKNSLGFPYDESCRILKKKRIFLYLYRSIRQLGMRLLITFSMLGQNAIPSMCFYGHSVLIPSSEVCGL